MMCVDSLGGGRRGCGAAAEWEGVPLHGHSAVSPLAFSSRLQVGRSRAQSFFLGQQVESFLSLGMLIIGLVLPVCLFFFQRDNYKKDRKRNFTSKSSQSQSWGWSIESKEGCCVDSPTEECGGGMRQEEPGRRALVLDQ